MGKMKPKPTNSLPRLRQRGERLKLSQRNFNEMRKTIAVLRKGLDDIVKADFRSQGASIAINISTAAMKTAMKFECYLDK